MRKYDWGEERVRDAVAKANCWFECLDILSIPKRGCNYRTLIHRPETMQTGNGEAGLGGPASGGVEVPRFELGLQVPKT